MNVRLGAGLLVAGMLAALAPALLGPLFAFASWALAAGGLLVLVREPDLERPAGISLAVLVFLIVLALGGAGLSLALHGDVVTRSEGFDATAITVDLGIVAAWLAAATLVATFDARRHRALGVVAGGGAAIAVILLTLGRSGGPANEIVPGVVVSPNVGGLAMGLAAVLTVVALLRISFSADLP